VFALFEEGEHTPGHRIAVAIAGFSRGQSLTSTGEGLAQAGGLEGFEQVVERGDLERLDGVFVVGAVTKITAGMSLPSCSRTPNPSTPGIWISRETRSGASA